MKRAILQSVLFAVSLLILPPALTAQEAPFDILIRGDRIIDGTGNPWYFGDVGIRLAPRLATLARDPGGQLRTTRAHRKGRREQILRATAGAERRPPRLRFASGADSLVDVLDRGGADAAD